MNESDEKSMSSHCVARRMTRLCAPATCILLGSTAAAIKLSESICAHRDSGYIASSTSTNDPTKSIAAPLRKLSQNKRPMDPTITALVMEKPSDSMAVMSVTALPSTSSDRKRSIGRRDNWRCAPRTCSVQLPWAQLQGCPFAPAAPTLLAGSCDTSFVRSARCGPPHAPWIMLRALRAHVYGRASLTDG
jgi:hypothetical protein